MDLRNNELGFEIGKNNKNASKDDLKNIIIEQIKAGNAWKLKKMNGIYTFLAKMSQY